MPANLTPEYKQAAQALRQMREPRERLECLKEMLRTIPKHKGTEHLQAELRSRIKQLSEELTSPRQTGRTGPSYSVRPEGAAQVCLIGPPNAGKSSLHARLTGSHSDIGPYPYTTQQPVPGMLPFEDIHFQLIDLPPISKDFMEPWLVNVLQSADAVLLVVDLSDPECLEHVLTLRERLAAKRILLAEHWPGLSAADEAAPPGTAAEDEEELPDPFRIVLPTLLIANKSDLDPEPAEVTVLEELLGVRFPAIATSAVTGQGLDGLGPLLFRGLAIVRVYTKAPGHSPDRDRPITLRRGATVLDVARLVHKDIAQSLRFARIWGSGQFDGQQVGPEHAVADGDVIELHTR